MNKARYTYFVISAIFLMSASASAQLPDQRDSLRDLYPPVVGIQRVNDDARRNGLDSQQIRTDVELRLRRAGVPISERKSDGLPAYPQLYVRADVAKHGDRYNYSVRLEVLAAVDLDLTKARSAGSINRFAVATIWSEGGFGIVSAESLEKEIRARVADLVDQFINDYLAANSKR